MNYYAPCYNDLGGIGESMNPMQNFPPVHMVEPAIFMGPTRVMANGQAGQFEIAHAGLDGWRDAVDMLTAVNFLFPV
jgi:hypothetical protein